jgi:hypothetical protein
VIKGRDGRRTKKKGSAFNEKVLFALLRAFNHDANVIWDGLMISSDDDEVISK